VSLTGRLVFVVDDDASIRRALGRLFRSLGMEFETFSSAEDVLLALERRVPACLILDVRLPGLSGLELQEQLVSSGRHIPIIIITAHGDEQAKRQALAAGAFGFLLKPFDEQTLLEAVVRTLNATEWAGS
jgi:FixJ family two-component response regulator